jgi:hydroxymethylpyrimidine/phosphomethylpyrimidine kinase
MLTMADLDPSSGAGITLNTEICEAHHLYGLSAYTTPTVQNNTRFKECIWREENSLLNQIKILFDRFLIAVVKTGIAQSREVLLAVLETVKRRNSIAKIALDPVLKSGADFVFALEQDLPYLKSRAML